MIQRKQSLWLFLASALNSGLFYFSLYNWHNVTHTAINGADHALDTTLSLNVTADYPSLLLAILITLLPLITIFLFANRKMQVKLSLVSVLGTAAFVQLMFMRVSNLSKLPVPPVSGSFGVAAPLPVISLVLLIMAIMAIRRDEKLVKSVDRLR